MSATATKSPRKVAASKPPGSPVAARAAAPAAEEKSMAVPLISEENGKLKLHDDALKILGSLHSKVGVVSVAGLWRTGKSFLLNRLMGRQSGFRTGHTINGCTRGVWLWAKPVERVLPDGEKMSVLVIDTEGLGATDNTQSHDARIFSLAVLLSSLFIYNSSGPIDEHAIQSLSFIANLTRNIHVRSRPGDEADDGLDYHAYFPTLLWVLRDFALELSHDGRPITSKEYMEGALKQQTGFSERLITKNQIRSMLTSFFRERDCVALVRPMEQEDALQKLEDLPSEKLRPEFRDGVEKLKLKVFGGVRPKAVNGRALNGPMLAALIGAYVDAINRGAAPCIQSAWEAVVEIECQGAAGAAVKAYRAAMEQAVGGRLPVDPPELHNAHVAAKQAGGRAFQEAAVGTDIEKYRAILKTRYGEEYDAWVSRNEDESIRLCKRLLAELSAGIEKKLASGAYQSYSAFDVERLAFRAQYLAQARGPAKYVAYGDWVEPKMSEAALKLSLQAESVNTAERTRLREAAEAAERRLLDATIGFEREKAALKEQRESVERKLAEVQGREAVARESLAEARKQQDTSSSDWRGLLERADGDQRELRGKLEETQAQLVEATRSLAETRLELEREKLREQPHQLAMKKELEEAQLRVIQLQAQVDVFKGKRKEEPSKATKQAASATETAKLEKLKAKFAEERAQLTAECEAKLTAARAQHDEERREWLRTLEDERREAKKEKEEAIKVAVAGLDELKTELRSQLSQAQSRLAMSEQAREALQRRYDVETAALRAEVASAREEATRGAAAMADAKQKLLEDGLLRSDEPYLEGITGHVPSRSSVETPNANSTRQCGCHVM